MPSRWRSIIALNSRRSGKRLRSAPRRRAFLRRRAAMGDRCCQRCLRYSLCTYTMKSARLARSRSRGRTPREIYCAEAVLAPAVSLQVRQEPRDGVVRIGGFVVGCAIRRRTERSHVLERPLRPIASAHLLRHEDVAVPEHERVGCKGERDARGIVRPHAEWRALQHDRVTTPRRRVPRHRRNGHQPRTVARRHLHDPLHLVPTRVREVRDRRDCALRRQRVRGREPQPQPYDAGQDTATGTTHQRARAGSERAREPVSAARKCTTIATGG